MEKGKDELLNFAFNEQDDKLKFYRETLVEMIKEAYRKMPNELKIEESVVEADLLTKAIMKQVDEFKVAMEQHFNLDEERVNYYTNNTMWTGPASGPSFIGATTFLKTEPMGIKDSVKEEVLNKFIETANVAFKNSTDLSSNSIKQMADSVKDSMKTVVDNGPQYQPNQKPYGTLGEHWKELMVLFDVKDSYGKNWKTSFDTIIKNYKKYKCASTVLVRGSMLDPIADSLGIEFIEDFVKACEKCED